MSALATTALSHRELAAASRPFNPSPEDAAGWLVGNPGAEVVPVAEAHRIGADLTAALLAGTQPTTDDTSTDRTHCC